MAYAILLASCPDQKGITAVVTDFIYRRGGNIVDADQHTDIDASVFFIRVKWELEGFRVSRDRISEEFSSIAKQFSMDWRIAFSDHVPRIAVFVSRHLHCLYDLWFRHISGHLPCDFRLVISNHTDAASFCAQSGVDFLHTPVSPQTKDEQELRQLEILADRQIDLVVLARYHQILTPAFVERYSRRIINIHHSFLPAFAGGSPYAQAYQKGVKIIGATSHYVIPELDQGPIIDQDTVRVTHRDSIADMMRIGQDLERVVLYKAVRWHLEHKIFCCGNKTVVFD